MYNTIIPETLSQYYLHEFLATTASIIFTVNVTGYSVGIHIIVVLYGISSEIRDFFNSLISVNAVYI